MGRMHAIFNIRRTRITLKLCALEISTWYFVEFKIINSLLQSYVKEPIFVTCCMKTCKFTFLFKFQCDKVHRYKKQIKLDNLNVLCDSRKRNKSLSTVLYLHKPNGRIFCICHRISQLQKKSRYSKGILLRNNHCMIIRLNYIKSILS